MQLGPSNDELTIVQVQKVTQNACFCYAAVEIVGRKDDERSESKVGEIGVFHFTSAACRQQLALW